MPRQRFTTPTRRRFLLAAITFTLIAIAASFWSFRSDKGPTAMTAAVSRGDIEATVLASGTVEANNLVSVGAQVSGQLKVLKVSLGDTVKAGQLVAEIDSLPQQNTLRNKTAALAAISAQKQAKEASLRQAELAYKRQQQMLQGEAASRADFENAEATLAVTKAEIATLQAQIEQARIGVDTAQLDLGYTKINSPIDGVVVAIVTKEGQTVNANQSAPTIIKVARLDRVTIKVEISEADVVRVRPGQRVYFTILGEPDNRYPAELVAIEPAPESIAKETTNSTTTTASTAIYYMGILDVPNTDGKLRISMTTQVNIVLTEAKDVLLIPAAALGNKTGEGRYAVRVETAPGKIKEQQVRIGLNNNVQAEVVAGLAEGQRVVIGEQVGGAAGQTATPQRRPRMPRMF